jgi:hypothetical protein
MRIAKPAQGQDIGRTRQRVGMTKREGSQQPKTVKKDPIPERTHWILRKMIRQRQAELCDKSADTVRDTSGSSGS